MKTEAAHAGGHGNVTNLGGAGPSGAFATVRQLSDDPPVPMLGQQLGTKEVGRFDEPPDEAPGTTTEDESNCGFSGAICPMFDAESSDDEGDQLLATTEHEVTVEVAQDSGCVCHVCCPEQLPGSAIVTKPADGKLRRLVAANNTPIQNHGITNVIMQQDDGSELGGSFQVADVSRPLHSTSQICDSESRRCPEGHEVLFTRKTSIVVPAGALSRFLKHCRKIAEYPRKGGLYVAKMKLKTPKPESSFTRQGAGR